MFGNTIIGILLFITHILSCITVGILFRFWKKDSVSNCTTKKNFNESQNINFSSLGEILSNSIYNAIFTIMMIGGFVVLFSVIISIFNASKFLNILTILISPYFNLLNIPTTFVAPILTGFLEITNGISLISNIHIKAISLNIIFTSFLLGIGGISIFLQVFSIVSKTDLSIKPYILGKLLQGVIAALYTFLFIKLFPVFNFNL